MQPIKIKIRNYRNITLDSPIELEIKEGITFILGPNNVGKTNLLRLFSELGPIFSRLRNFSRGNHREVLNTNVLFDHIVNRKSQNRPIELWIDLANQIYHVEITPVAGQIHSTQWLVSYEAGVKNSEVSFDNAPCINLVDILYFGSFRGINFNVTGQTGNIKIGSDFIKLWSG